MNKEDIIQAKVEELRTYLSISEEILLNELNDYIKQLQQENKQLKDKLNKILKEVDWIEELANTCERVDINGVTIYKILKGDNNE